MDRTYDRNYPFFDIQNENCCGIRIQIRCLTTALYFHIFLSVEPKVRLLVFTISIKFTLNIHLTTYIQEESLYIYPLQVCAKQISLFARRQIKYVIEIIDFFLNLAFIVKIYVCLYESQLVTNIFKPLQHLQNNFIKM